ncbi:hypothetical protein J007_01806 [Cryptococcus neoformans]|nr:hypothetical protein J007_01806 [Cryptococcus neoformans var. grubii]OXC62847.1 hypothetical protein C358_01813 [Cryptococcus neoformans var. grubii MW-RSA852]
MRSGARKWIARKRNWRNLLGRTRRKQSVLAEEKKELEAWRNARAAEGASSATASSS